MSLADIQTVPRNCLVLLTGLPGTGKSAFTDNTIRIWDNRESVWTELLTTKWEEPGCFFHGLSERVLLGRQESARPGDQVHRHGRPVL